MLVRDELCRGERKCWKACPYGAPQFADDKAGTKMSKCNMCIDRLAQGQQPVCVLACPTRALDFGPMDKISQQYGNLRVLHQMPGEKKTMPSVIFKARTEKKKIIPHDPDRTLQLFSQGENTLLKYESVETMTNIPPGAVKRNRLVMKPRNCKERDRNLLLAEVRDCTISGPRNPAVVCFTSLLSSLTAISSPQPFCFLSTTHNLP